MDDLTLPDMLHVAVLRSSFAHARLRQVDTRQALEQPGVVAAFSASDLGDYWRPGPLLVPPPPISNLEFVARTQVPLARHKLRHVGEPVAVVVAQSRYQAEDALDWIEVEADPLPVVTELEQAIEPGAPLVHEDLENNVAAKVLQEKGNYAQARRQADLLIERCFK